MNLDIFNGDADGICALQQLRLAQPREAELITGVKRDINLLDQLQQRPDLDGAQLTVLDISMAVNGEALRNLLEKGASVFYADHHKAGDIPDHPCLEHHIDLTPATCTSVIINDLLDGQFAPWAVAAAFGDNFHDTAQGLADDIGLNEAEVGQLRELGELLNYNGYGRELGDLHFHPAELFRAAQAYENPLHFFSEAEAMATLRQGYKDDMTQAEARKAHEERDNGRLFIFPDAPWARRSAGVFSNAKAREEENKAHALLVDNGDNSYVVSVRAPLASKQGAVELCQQFPTGGGRAAAAGINRLPASDLDRFSTAFFSAFNDSA